MEIPFRALKISVLPFQGLRNFALSCLVLFAALTILERIVIPHLEDQRKLGAFSWQSENIRINRDNYHKNKATPESIVWRSDGFPVSEEKSQAKRILVIGDSFVWGDGYANLNDIWWRQLQRELASRGYSHVEVIGAGYCGLSTHEELTQARKIILRYDPDLVIWGYVTNDPDERLVKQLYYVDELEDSVARAAGKEGGDQATRDWISRIPSTLFPNIRMLLKSRRNSKLAVELSNEQNGYDYNTWESKILEGANFEAYKKTVHDLASFIRQSGTPTFMMALPTYPSRNYFRPKYQKVEPVFAQAGIDFKDTLDDLLAEYGNLDDGSSGSSSASLSWQGLLSWGINPVNGHPGTRATHFYAVEAANYLEKKYPQVMGEKELPVRAPVIRINDWMPPELMTAAQTGDVDKLYFHFNYPVDVGNMLTMPFRRPHVQLDLDEPVELGELRVKGPPTGVMTVYVTVVNRKEGYDDGQVYLLGKTVNGKMVRKVALNELPGPVNSIEIIGRFIGAQDRGIELQLLRAGK